MSDAVDRIPPADALGDFSSWVEPHLPALARLAARLGPPGEAEDIVQDSLGRAWTKRRLFDPSRGTPAAWLLAITADQARKAWRRKRPLPLHFTSARIRSLDDELDLEFAVSRLPERQRLAVDCFYFVGLSVAETAAVLGCAEGTVKSTLSDARARLRSLLQVEDGRQRHR
ncbi:MAG TPA: sigma-70 family RNA polymerase sigma factor [Candidatus Limnocylindrales bacterium]